MVARTVPWNRVCSSFSLSFHLSVRPFFSLSRCFLGIVLLIFSKFWHGARIPCQVMCDGAGFFRKIFFAPKIGKMGPKWVNQGFFNLLESLVINFYWIWSIMKIYIICCFPAQIPFLGKFLFLRYGPKCSQPIRLQDYLINHISRTNQWNAWFFSCWYKSCKLKVDQKILGRAWLEMGVASLVTGL